MGWVFLGFSVLMLAVAAVVGFGIVPVAPSVRWLLAGALGVAGVLEALIGQRCMGKR
jgi:hypothetical protein